MKQKNIIYIISCILIFLSILFLLNRLNTTKSMSYKFEDSKLYIKIGSEDWTEVPYDFSLIADYLTQNNNGKYYEGTYQMDNNKIVFYYIKETPSINNNSNVSKNILNMIDENKYITYIVYSDDMGKNWTAIDIGRSSTIENIITNIHFSNRYEGTMILKNLNIEYTYNTKNGGQDWETVDK